MSHQWGQIKEKKGRLGFSSLVLALILDFYNDTADGSCDKYQVNVFEEYDIADFDVVKD